MKTYTGFRRIATAGMLVIVAGAASGCGESDQNPAVGDMLDTSYYGQRGSVVRPNANGDMVSLDEYDGSFIWAEYAAPWCSHCEPQAKATRDVARSFGRDVVFLTIMTSDMGGYGDPATPSTAYKWAARFRLDPVRVLAADLTAMTIPKHILFSPDGHVLYEKTGRISGTEIRATLDRYMDDYRNWKRDMVFADWMH